MDGEKKGEREREREREKERERKRGRGVDSTDLDSSQTRVTNLMT